MNVYDGSCLRTGQRPIPLKSLTHLTTVADQALFNPTSEILAILSKRKKSALRLVGIITMLPACTYVCSLSCYVLCKHVCDMCNCVCHWYVTPSTYTRTYYASVNKSATNTLLVLALEHHVLFLQVHLPSMTVFPNWPTSRSPLSFPNVIDFSADSRYIGIGNEKGRALLYRLKHYITT